MGSVNAEYSPVHVVLGRTANPGNAGFPLNSAPSFNYLGGGLQDHRMAYNSRGSSIKQPGVVGWYGTEPIVAHYAPSAIATANIAALANVVNGTPMTLVSSSGAGITVLSAAAPAFFMPFGTTVTAGVVIDGLPSLNVFGGGGGNFQTGFYDRATYVGRGVSITGVAGGSGGNFLIKGYDCYGAAISQLLTVGAGAVTANTTKTFKAITSVTPQFTNAFNYSVGTSDIFGFGLQTLYWGDVFVNYNNNGISASTGYVAAFTGTSTTTTGDVRGTYALQSPSDGTKRLIFQVSPTVAALVTNPTIGLFGVAQA